MLNRLTAISLIHFGIVVGWATMLGGVSRADRIDAGRMFYSHGVHQYFSGQSVDAVESLTQAIECNPQDPRPYYFRAMASLRLGRTQEARQDMSTGAMLEAQRPGRYDVGSALERVQGTGRILLEEHRRDARLAAALGRERHRQRRYEQLQHREAEVRRRPIPIRLEELSETVPSGAFVVPAIRQTPVGESSPPESAAATRPAEESLPDAQRNPFADDPLPAAPTGPATDEPADNPSAGELTLPSESDVGDRDSSGEPENPGETLEQEDDPFGGIDEENPFNDF